MTGLLLGRRVEEEEEEEEKRKGKANKECRHVTCFDY